MRLASLLVPTLVACCASVAAAQVTVIDEGTFSLTVGGERVGREDFSIRVARGGGAAFVAQGTILFGERRVAVAVNVDSAGTPIRFQIEAREGRSVLETYVGLQARGLWSGRAVRTDGESSRESRLPVGALAVEEQFVHQLWFPLRFGGGGDVTIFAPRSLAVREARVVEIGPDRVTIGLVEIGARHWIIRPAAGGEPLWEVWTDATGRLLRIRDHVRGLEALRDEVPRP